VTTLLIDSRRGVVFRIPNSKEAAGRTLSHSNLVQADNRVKLDLIGVRDRRMERSARFLPQPVWDCPRRVVVWGIRPVFRALHCRACGTREGRLARPKTAGQIKAKKVLAAPGRRGPSRNSGTPLANVSAAPTENAPSCSRKLTPHVLRYGSGQAQFQLKIHGERFVIDATTSACS
jgi:hypothetical protein